MKQLIIKILLTVAIIALAYFVVQSILTPLKFNRLQEERSEVVIQNLKDIRSAQLIFKSMNNQYAADFDTLIWFIKNGEIPVVKIIPDPEDTTFTKTINDTLGYVNVGDSLFNTNHLMGLKMENPDKYSFIMWYREHFNIDSLRYIPFSNGQQFELAAGEIKSGGLNVNVFEASALYKQFLTGLDKQLIINLIKAKEDLDKLPGLKVGSMQEASTDGNWE